MAQLREAKTSEILHEGTPLECVALAREIGFDKILFDDVGAGFDPEAVWIAHEENVAGLKAASTVKATPDEELRESITNSHTAAVEEVNVAALAEKVEAERAEIAARVE